MPIPCSAVNVPLNLMVRSMKSWAIFLDRLPFLLIPAVDDQDRMEIAVADMAEDGDGEVVFVADLLELTDRFGNLGDGDPKVLHKGDQLCSPPDLGKGRDEALAACPHLQAF